MVTLSGVNVVTLQQIPHIKVSVRSFVLKTFFTKFGMDMKYLLNVKILSLSHPKCTFHCDDGVN